MAPPFYSVSMTLARICPEATRLPKPSRVAALRASSATTAAGQLRHR